MCLLTSTDNKQSCRMLPYLVIAPIEMVLIYYILYSYIGIATLPGYVLMLMLTASQTMAGKYFYRFRFISNCLCLYKYSFHLFY